jgi:PAS domain S-box-containing protein
MVALAAIIHLLLVRSFGSLPLFIVMYPQVLIVVSVAGRGPGILSTILSALTIDYLFMTPSGSLEILATNDAIAVGIFSCTSIALCFLAEHIHRAKRDQAVNVEREKDMALLDMSSFMIMDPDRRILRWSEGNHLLYGYTADEVRAQNCRDMLQTVFTEPLEKIDKELHELGHWSGDAIRIGKDGAKLFVTLLWALRRGESGRPESILEVNTNNTKRMIVENILLESTRKNEFLAGIVQNSSQPFGLGYPDGRLGFINKAFEELTGYTQDELNLLDWNTDLTPPEWRELEMQKLRELQPTVKAVSYEKEYIRKNGSRVPIELRTHIKYDVLGNLEYYYAFITDITERKKSEKEILNLNKNLIVRNAELQNLAREQESFVYSISHDLRAPLRAISGFSKILVDDYIDKLDIQCRDYLNRINNGAITMTSLIDDLLRISRVSNQNIEPIDCDLSEIANEVIKNLKTNSSVNNITTIVAPEMQAVADPSLIKIALENILGNAFKFTAKKNGAHIEFGVLEMDNGKVYFVKDNGAGFNSDYAAKIFFPFQRLHSDNEYEGTGIGLAIVERIIRHHDGKIWAESAIDQGTIIYFTLRKY